jgi:hypothetical protein
VHTQHPCGQVLHVHVTHLGGLSPSDSIMVLDLSQGRRESGPDPARPLQGARSHASGGGTLPLYRRGN